MCIRDSQLTTSSIFAYFTWQNALGRTDRSSHVYPLRACHLATSTAQRITAGLLLQQNLMVGCWVDSTQLQERAKLFTTSPVHYCWTNCYQPHKQKIYFERRLSLRRARKRQLRTGSGAEGFRTERAPGQDSGCEALEVDSFFVDVHQ